MKHPILTFGVEPDGTLNYRCIETYLACVMMHVAPRQFGFTVMEHEGKRWVEFIIDQNGYEEMVRLPQELITQMNDALQKDPADD